MLSKNSAVICWMENIGDDTLIQVRRVNTDGTKGEPMTISKTSAERSSGFPQIELRGDKIYVAWTQVDGETTTINTASIASNHL